MTLFKPGMKVHCIEGKTFHHLSTNLTKDKVYTVDLITYNGFVQVKEYKGISLKQSRFIIADLEYNPVIYKIREMQERFEKRSM